MEEDLAPFPGAHTRPVDTEETGTSTTAVPKDDVATPAPFLCLSGEEPVAANNSNSAPSGANEAVKVGPSADSAALAAAYATPAAVVMEEDLAPFPGAHPRPVDTEEIGLSAAAGPKDDDGVLPPSLCLSEEQLVAEYSSNGAPLGVNKATKVGPSTQIDLVTPATTSGPRETPSGGASSATLAADSAALTADFAALVADSAALVADSSALAAAYAPPVAGVMEEDRAPFPGAHARPIPPSPHHARVGMIQRTVIQRSTVNQYVDDTALLSDICHVVG